MRILSAIASLSILVAGAEAPAAGRPAATGAMDIVARHRAIFDAPPRGIPSRAAVDAPLLGNGDVLVALGGDSGNLQFYVGKNDLWVMRTDSESCPDLNSRPQPLARLEIAMPDMQGASYHVEQDFARAVTTGRFEKDGKTVSLETGVAATENLLWIKLATADCTVSGRAGFVIARLTDNDQPAAVGRELFGGGRWYFDGQIADVVVTDKVLSGRPPAGPKQAEQFDGRTTWRELKAPKMDNTVSVAAWIKIAKISPSANYIVSKGEWNRAYSLGLSGGRLRWAIGDICLESARPLETGKWLYVVGTYDHGLMRLYVDGRNVAPTAVDTRRVGDVQLAERRFEEGVMTPAGAACAVRILDVNPGEQTAVGPPVEKGGASFTIAPERPILIVAAVRSRFNAKDFPAAASERAARFRAKDLDAVRSAHQAWWRGFWEQSFVEIPDKTIEQRYYLSNYVMASASRVRDFPPGHVGWATTDNSLWNGDYHLNYNHVAPFYGLYAGNRIEQADPCHGPILANAEQARELCRRKLGVEGIFQYIAIGPRGSLSGAIALMQKSCASYSCVPLAFRWYATYDLDFARQAYPFVRDVALFWENWLKFENGRYVIVNDAIHENSGNDFNPLLSLGLVRMVMNLALDMSAELDIDAGRRAKWEHIRDHISEYPTCTVADLPERFRPKDQTLWTLPIFRYTERGTPWWNSNTLGIQHIFPAGGIGLDSPARLLERARNQIRILDRWIDINGMNSFYCAAARVGYDPNVILKEMRAMLDELGLPNGMIRGNPHGMEQQSIVPNAIQEMLMQSHEGVIRFFPCWPKDQDARFETLRARGAFLVSAEQKNGTICGVRITSEKGRDCTILNPWPGRRVRVLRDGEPSETVSGERVTLATRPATTLELQPE